MTSREQSFPPRPLFTFRSTTLARPRAHASYLPSATPFVCCSRFLFSTPLSFPLSLSLSLSRSVCHASYGPCGLIVASRRRRLVSRLLPMEEGGVNNHDSKLSLPGRSRDVEHCRARPSIHPRDFPSTCSIVNRTQDPSCFPMRPLNFPATTTGFSSRPAANVTAVLTRRVSRIEQLLYTTFHRRGSNHQ